MFSTYPQTPRLLEAKDELRAMMEDAYTKLIAEGRSENEAVGQVIRDFGNLEEVAPVLGITGDIHPASAEVKDADERDWGSPSTTEDPPVTMDEARGYADAHRRVRFHTATAVILFVLSPVTLITLTSAAGARIVPFSESVAVFIGLLVLLVAVAAGAMILVAASRRTAPYQRITEHRFAGNPEVANWAKGLNAQHEHARTRALQVAIALWILAPIPLMAFTLLLGDSPREGFWSAIGVVLVLVLVATGLGILLPQAWARGVAETLAQTGHRPGRTGDRDDGERSVVNVIGAFYWPLVFVIYLTWSFTEGSWAISWIVWPIGGVLFGAIAAGAGAIESYRRALA